MARDDGFSLIEAVIALTLIFTSLTAMVYTATIGFKYAAFARERQAATSIADQVMEGMRGIAWSRFIQGVKTSDLDAESAALGSASNVIQCGTPAVWYFRSSLSMTCSNVGGAAPAPEKVVNTPNLPNQCTGTPAVPCPMVPNTGTVSSSATVKYPTTFTWRVYPTVSNASGIYKLYVKVAWSGTQFGTGVVRSITVQSTFYNPAGCVSSDVHPFSGPCEPQYTGASSINAAGVVITSASAVAGVNFNTASLVVPNATASSIVEQVPKLAGAATYGGIEVIATAGGATTVYGETSLSTSADDNPTTTGVTTYQTAGPTSSSPASPSALNAGNGTLLSLLFGATSGTSSVATTSATAPSATQTCAATAGPFTVQSDGNPCVQSWSRVSQPMSATIDLAPAAGVAAGTAGYASTLASIGVTGSSTYSAGGSADRLTTLAGGVDAIQHTSIRSLGTVTLFTFPSICTTFPPGWDNGKGLIQVTNYSDSAVATAGPSTSTAVASVTAGGNPNAVVISYYNGSGYTNIVAKDLKRSTAGVTNLAIPSTPIQCSASVGSPARTLLVSLSAPSTAGTSIVSSGKNEQATTSATTGIRTAQAQFGSPVFGTVGYTVTYNGAVKSDLLVAVDLGTVVAKASYTPPPTGG